MRDVRRRYERLEVKLKSQVLVLQSDRDFRVLCSAYYQKGYKDWLILSGIYNCVLNWRAQSHGLDLVDPSTLAKFADLGEEMCENSYPAWRFDKEIMDQMIGIHNVLVLRTYGFEPRRMDFHLDAVERFLRERMDHFSADLPHNSLFGDPPGQWPV